MLTAFIDVPLGTLPAASCIDVKNIFKSSGCCDDLTRDVGTCSELSFDADMQIESDKL